MPKATKHNAARVGTVTVLELDRPPELPENDDPKFDQSIAQSLSPEKLLEEYDHHEHGLGSLYEGLRAEVLLRLQNAPSSLTNGSGATAAAKMMSGGLDPREMAHKRWGVDWHNIPVSEGNVLLGDLKEEFERAAKIMQQRQTAALTVICACGCGRTLMPGQACMSRTLRDPATLLPYNIYFATQECVRQQNKKQYGMAEMIK